eukprot:2975738-Rhodomonas_salina.1
MISDISTTGPDISTSTSDISTTMPHISTASRTRQCPASVPHRAGPRGRDLSPAATTTTKGDVTSLPKGTATPGSETML